MHGDVHVKPALSEASCDTAQADYELWMRSAWFVLWILLAVGIFLQMCLFIETASAGIESLHILVLAVRRIIMRDVAKFMALYAWLTATALATLFIIYPRSGNRSLDLFPEFNDHILSSVSLVELAIFGNSFYLHTQQSDGMDKEMVPLQQLALALFVGFYFCFVLLLVVVMMNLLVALLSNTFDDVQLQSTLQSRLGFARRLVRLELVANALGMRTRVGEPIKTSNQAAVGSVAVAPERYFHIFRAMVQRERDYGEEELDEETVASRMGENFMAGAATDPFKGPTPTPIARIEKIVSELMKSAAAERRATSVEAKSATKSDTQALGVLDLDTFPSPKFSSRQE